MMECRLTILNSLGHPVTTLDSEVSAPIDVRDAELGPRIECEVAALPLLPGRYRIDVLLKGKRQIQDGLQAAGFFDVEPGVVVQDRPMPICGRRRRRRPPARLAAAGMSDGPERSWASVARRRRPSRWRRSIGRRPSRS